MAFFTTSHAARVRWAESVSRKPQITLHRRSRSQIPRTMESWRVKPPSRSRQQRTTTSASRELISRSTAHCSARIRRRLIAATGKYRARRTRTINCKRVHSIRLETLLAQQSRSQHGDQTELATDDTDLEWISVK